MCERVQVLLSSGQSVLLITPQQSNLLHTRMRMCARESETHFFAACAAQRVILIVRVGEYESEGESERREGFRGEKGERERERMHLASSPLRARTRTL